MPEVLCKSITWLRAEGKVVVGAVDGSPCVAGGVQGSPAGQDPGARTREFQLEEGILCLLSGAEAQLRALKRSDLVLVDH